MNTDEAKEQLRTQLRTRRKAIATPTRLDAEKALAQRLLTLPEVGKAATIGVYQAYGSELGLDAFLAAARSLEQPPVIAYPCVTSETGMVFARFDADDMCDMPEDPKALASNIPAERIVSAADLDLLLVPGIGFDTMGRRLGQGGGYYDRWLSRAKTGLVTIGIAFDEQIVPEVPCAAHDHKVDLVVTPTRLIVP